MGDRYTWYEDCPKCGGKGTLEMYDAPSCMQYSGICNECDYVIDLGYYEESENHLILISMKEARERGYLCKKCNSYLWIDERGKGICADCKEVNNE